MARIRSIKPEFWSSAEVMSLPRDARLLFIGIWNFADDHGRFKWTPATIKAQVFPGDQDLDAREAGRLMGLIAERGLIRRYWDSPEDSGKLQNSPEDSGGFAIVTGWHHQKISHPTKSKYPEPKEYSVTTQAIPENSGKLQNPPEHSRTFAPDLIRSDLKGSEGKGSEDPSQLHGAESPRDPLRFLQPLEDAVRAEFFSRKVTPQKAGHAQWRDGCQTVQDALALGAFLDAQEAIHEFAVALVNACADGDKLGFALQQTQIEGPRPRQPSAAVYRIREGA